MTAVVHNAWKEVFTTAGEFVDGFFSGAKFAGFTGSLVALRWLLGLLGHCVGGLRWEAWRWERSVGVGGFGGGVGMVEAWSGVRAESVGAEYV